MATEIETTLPGRRITAGPTELYIEDTEWPGRRIRTKLRGDDAKKVAEALDPERAVTLHGHLPGTMGHEMALAIDRLTAERDEANARADAAEAKVRAWEKAGGIRVSEEDITAFTVDRSFDGRWFADDEFAGHENVTPEGKREQRDVALGLAAKHEAVARAIEAEQAVDPVEALAEELYEVGRNGDDPPWHLATENNREKHRRIARHQIERKDEDQ